MQLILQCVKEIGTCAHERGDFSPSLITTQQALDKSAPTFLPRNPLSPNPGYIKKARARIKRTRLPPVGADRRWAVGRYSGDFVDKCACRPEKTLHERKRKRVDVWLEQVLDFQARRNLRSARGDHLPNACHHELEVYQPPASPLSHQ